MSQIEMNDQKFAACKSQLKKVLVGVFDECKTLELRVTEAITNLTHVKTPCELMEFIENDIEQGLKYIHLDYPDDE